MLLFVSPLIIKKLLMNIFMTNLTVVMNAQAVDSVSVKRDERPVGRILKYQERELKFRFYEKWALYDPNEVDSVEKGMVVFECNVCGSKGQLKIFGSKPKTSTLSLIHFSSGESRHKELIKPGKYRWEFEDNRKNTSSGTLIVKSGETITISLFDSSKG